MKMIRCVFVKVNVVVLVVVVVGIIFFVFVINLIVSFD